MIKNEKKLCENIIQMIFHVRKSWENLWNRYTYISYNLCKGVTWNWKQ